MLNLDLLLEGANIKNFLTQNLNESEESDLFVKRYLKNGIPVSIERLPGSRSTALAIWVKMGSRYETLSNNGMSHFIEHLFFDGTTNRSQKDIAFEIDSIGGTLNAWTSKENTCFYTVVLNEFLETGTDILCDMISNSLFENSSIEKEKGVISEEIKGSVDNPRHLIYDLLYRNTWGDKGLGMPIPGPIENVVLFTREDLVKFYKKYYTSDNIIITCSGDVDPDKLVKMLDERLDLRERLLTEDYQEVEKPELISDYRVHDKDISDVYICVGLKSIAFNKLSEDLTFSLFNSVLGSGVSSRLWQKVREERGLVYSINSSLSQYRDVGLFDIYAATSSKSYKEVLNIILEELKTIKATITEDDLIRAKNQFRGQYKMQLDYPYYRMSDIGSQEIYYGKYASPDKTLSIMDKITLTDVKVIVEKFFTDEPYSVTVLGPVKDLK